MITNGRNSGFKSKEFNDFSKKVKALREKRADKLKGCFREATTDIKELDGLSRELCYKLLNKDNTSTDSTDSNDSGEDDDFFETVVETDPLK
jgi:S-adenosylhomocysteine hydrolase